MEDENINDIDINNFSNDELIDLFIDGIMEEKGVETPTDEIRKDVHDELKKQLLTEIDRSLVAELPDDKLDELKNTLDSTGKLDQELVAQAIKDANLDVTGITGVTMQRFREIYLGEQLQPSVEKTEV